MSMSWADWKFNSNNRTLCFDKANAVAVLAAINVFPSPPLLLKNVIVFALIISNLCYAAPGVARKMFLSSLIPLVMISSAHLGT